MEEDDIKSIKKMLQAIIFLLILILFIIALSNIDRIIAFTKIH